MTTASTLQQISFCVRQASCSCMYAHLLVKAAWRIVNHTYQPYFGAAGGRADDAAHQVDAPGECALQKIHHRVRCVELRGGALGNIQLRQTTVV